MADITGTLRHEHDGKSYALRLTLGGIGKLQGKHGDDLAGLLTGKFDGPGQIPPFSVMVDIVAVSLEKCGMAADEAADLADDMLTADQGIVARIMQAAFPQAKPGNAPAPTKAKG
ncbi:hypothetical protein [Paracoccus hibiscisoli]|uniref:hypothetical protein n=1 Tax=Paracoccus hibiscisoli TaxID=2023261 RepID=UPI0023F4498B|nr:hypothetical protein [Paracoccus hibiscisoli]